MLRSHLHCPVEWVRERSHCESLDTQMQSSETRASSLRAVWHHSRTGKRARISSATRILNFLKQCLRKKASVSLQWESYDTVQRCAASGQSAPAAKIVKLAPAECQFPLRKTLKNWIQVLGARFRWLEWTEIRMVGADNRASGAARRAAGGAKRAAEARWVVIGWQGG